MSLHKLDDHYNQSRYRYERNTPLYYTTPMRYTFNYQAYQAHYFRQQGNKRIMTIGKTNIGER